MKVFISHSHADAPWAARVSDALEQTGLEVWNFDRNLLPGDNWAAEVARALEESEAMVVLLTFILLAQFTTNLTLNILPPALVFMDTFKISWHQSVIVTGILGAFSFPWLLMANSDAFFGFILYYSAFFGPILGVMLADYFVIRKRELSVDALYNSGRDSEYWYRGGFNVSGLIAVFLPGIVTMIWFLPTAWMIGVPVAFVLYVLLYSRLERLVIFTATQSQ